jgi:DNA-binding Lrp family transcriptional regulator
MGVMMGSPGRATWTFLSNHGHVLLCLASEPGIRVRDIAALVGITERAVLRILGELEEAGYLTREHAGRRTHYRLALDRPMRHPLEARHSVRALVGALTAR